MGKDTSKRSQCDMILLYLKEHGSITALDAIREFGCMRLAARISDLRERGYVIEAFDEYSNNRYGDKIRHSRYFLHET